MYLEFSPPTAGRSHIATLGPGSRSGGGRLLRAVRQLVPDGNFDVLKNPMAAPPFLTDFLSR